MTDVCVFIGKTRGGFELVMAVLCVAQWPHVSLYYRVFYAIGRKEKKMKKKTKQNMPYPFHHDDTLY